MSTIYYNNIFNLKALKFTFHMYKIILVIITIAMFPNLSYTESATVNRYYSIKSKASIANIRTGPSINYPIKWVYKRPYWPVKIINKFERWFKIEDLFGEAGWIHESLLSKKRTVVVKANKVQEIYAKKDFKSRIIVVAENNVIGNIEKCTIKWCYIEIKKHEGWIPKDNLWGVEKNEIIE